jgi:NRPS condensation-like uncharacterized protein
MPRTPRLTGWDCLQLLTKKFSDQQVRMVVECDGRLDESRLAAAVRAAVEVEPILACRVQDRFFRPRWRPIPGFKAGMLMRTVNAADPGAEIVRLLGEDLDPFSGPLVRFSVVRGERDALVVNLDHTAGDAASVRALTYLLATLYNDPKRVSPARPDAHFAKRGFRSLQPLMAQSGGAKGRPGPPPPGEPGWRFPWREGVAEFRKRFLIRRLSPEKSAAIQDFCAARQGWLNDVFLAAYFRALARLVGGGQGARRLTVPVDLRAYLPARERPRIANFSASFEVALDQGLGGSLEETFGLVRAATTKEKQGRPGLGQAAFLTALADRVPYGIIRRRFETGKVRMTLPPPWFIALGVLRPESLAFGPVPARHAYSLQSVGRAGAVFQLSASLFAGSITLAVCFAGDDANEEVVTRFLDLYEIELPS